MWILVIIVAFPAFLWFTPKLKSIVVVGLERHYCLSHGEVLTLDHPKVGKAGEYFVTHDDYGYLSK